MSGGIIAASSGMRAQMDALDILANNLANLNTAGFKEQKSFYNVLDETLKGSMSAPDSDSPDRTVTTGAALNLADGLLVTTQRDLDLALAGDGFFAVSTPRGTRYTRNGSLAINGRQELCTPEGLTVEGESGPIVIGPGKVIINELGDVSLNGTKIGRIKIVTFDNPGLMIREGASLMAPPQTPQANAKAGTARVKQGFLEQSNVNPVGSVVEMVGIMRRFEAIQKSVNMMVNNLDTKSIEKLGR